MKLEDLTWLAGLWEGEGSFFVDMQKRKGVRYPYAIAQISMNCLLYTSPSPRDS